jgi:glyoxylase-like metal-dependent hydrolase (beta-lactamase superfamily II)
MIKTRFAIIDTCLWEVPRNEMIAPESPAIEAENRRYVIPGYCVYIEHPVIGKILYDTGCAIDYKNTWNATMQRDYKVIEIWDIRAKLAEMGTKIEDIDLLIMSHLHYDHAGNIKMFQHTKAGKKIILSEPEAKDAFVKVNLDDTGFSGVYLKREFQNLEGIGYSLISQDTKLADDFHLFIQKGHTPGVIGLMLTTGNGDTYIFPSDSIYSSINFGPPVILPGLCVSPDDYKANIEKVVEMKNRHNARIIYSHDVNDLKPLKKSPEFFE